MASNKILVSVICPTCGQTRTLLFGRNYVENGFRQRGYRTQCQACAVKTGWQKKHAVKLAKGLRHTTNEGYVEVWEEPGLGSKNGKWTHEHRLIMEQFLGRSLVRGESVHHRNGKRDDNRIENLELWISKNQHAHRFGQRVVDVCADYIAEMSGADRERFDARLKTLLEHKNKAPAPYPSTPLSENAA